MRLPRYRAIRHGTSMVEAAVVFFVFLTLVLGMLDLGIGVFRYNAVSEAARQGARQAIVHGQLAPPQLAQWGATTISTSASDTGTPIVNAIRPFLVGFNLNATTIEADWLDGDTQPGHRVRVTVSTPYRPIMTFIFGSVTYNLRASSTMPIAH